MKEVTEEQVRKLVKRLEAIDRWQYYSTSPCSSQFAKTPNGQFVRRADIAHVLYELFEIEIK